MSRVRVLVSGAAGRMGRVIVPGIRSALDLELVAEVDLGDDLAGVIARSRAQVVVDFTTPTAAMPNARAILASGAQGVIGTTGFSPEDMQALEAEARTRSTGLLVAPNFSLGMVLLQHFARSAIAHFPRAEIIESHHEGKLDAPSGTAMATARSLAAAGATASAAPDHLARGVDVGGVRVHSLRLPGVHARMEVLFGGAHETLRLSHDALSRECYLPGVLAGIRAMADGRTGLWRGLESVLFGAPG